jgi:hypothetical protein
MRHRPDRHTHTASSSPQTQALNHERRTAATTARWLSVGAAIGLPIGGYVHFCLYRHGYRYIPKIGVSFLIQALVSVMLTAALLAELRVGEQRRRSTLVAQTTRLIAIGLSVGTLAALGIAHTPGGLFHFREIGLRPAPQTLVAIIAESITTVLLGLAILEGWASNRKPTAIAAAVQPAARSERTAA